MLASPLQALGLNKFPLPAWSRLCLTEVEMDSEQFPGNSVLYYLFINAEA